jgi:site-specific DNA-methyltransferase (adenine-specific)
MKPYYRKGGITIYHADCRDVLPHVDADLIVTDPPYGGRFSFDYQLRFSPSPGSKRWWSNRDRKLSVRHSGILGDGVPFDPSHLLSFPCKARVLWGANWYANRLPDSGGWWVWDKRGGERDVSAARWPMSEGELAWTDVGKGIRFFRHTWFGLIRDSERGSFLHPAQKPVALMRWCIETAKTKGTILDPYMGSGPTLEAAVQLGRRAIGVEAKEQYCEEAANRLRRAA